LEHHRAICASINVLHVSPIAKLGKEMD